MPTTHAKTANSGMVKSARKILVQAIPANPTAIPMEHALFWTKKTTHATATKTTSGAPKHCNASAPVRIIPAVPTPIPTNSAMTTMSKDSTAVALSLTTGTQKSTLALKNVTPIRVPTKKTATDTVPMTQNTDMCAAVSTDMCGCRFMICATKICVFLIHAKISKIPTEHAK